MRNLKILGSGDAFASGGKYTTAFYISDSEGGILLDCGASTAVRLKQENIKLNQIAKVFLTHFHGDHYGGVPFLLITNKFEFGGTHPMTIMGPIGLKDQLRTLQEAMYPGTGALLDDLPLEFVEYDHTKQTVGSISFQAFEVEHAPPSSPHGIKLWLGEKILAFTGDTEWHENLVHLAQDSELLITECNNLDTESPGHLSLQTIRKERPRLKAKQIALSHMGTAMLDEPVEDFIKLIDGQEINLW